VNLTKAEKNKADDEEALDARFDPTRIITALFRNFTVI
jgi:hypothetical protein